MFIPKQQLKSALGPLQSQPERLYFQKMCSLFKPMNIPAPGDWLHSHPEKHQAYTDYKLPYYNQVTPERRTIYLQEFGKFQKGFIKELCAFCEVFYPKMLVKCLPVLEFEKELTNVKKRKHTYGDQFLAQDILAYMEKNVPKDAYCVMGITLNDIYPGQNWNFVYGWAKYKARVGIFSFLRWDEQYAQGQTKQINWKLIFYPSIRTMVHEIGHMFAITHCVYYRCLMNGFNNIEENYLNPLEFCPICFRKIWKNIGFDRKKRYEGLIEYCGKAGVKELEADGKFYGELWTLSKEEEKKGNGNTNTNGNNVKRVGIEGQEGVKKEIGKNRGKSMAPIRRS